jgi:hypothetical protein
MLERWLMSDPPSHDEEVSDCRAGAMADV